MFLVDVPDGPSFGFPKLAVAFVYPLHRFDVVSLPKSENASIGPWESRLSITPDAGLAGKMVDLERSTYYGDYSSWGKTYCSLFA